MDLVMKHSKILITALIAVWTMLPLWGQGTRTVESNEDFDGKRRFVIWDSFVYPQEVLGKEQLRIEYACREEDPAFHEGKSEGRWILQTGTSYSRFCSEARFKGDSLFAEDQSRLARVNQWTREASFITLHDCYYIDRHSGTLSFTGRLVGDDYLYEEPIPQLSWIITDSVRIVCGNLCREARCNFRGRKFTAYFAEDIPISSGPWKLQGLPGLILEAFDEEQRIHYTAVRIFPMEGNITRAKYPYIRVTRKEYAKMISQMQKQYLVFANSHISRTNIVEIDMEDNKTASKRKACVPLERD